MGEIIRGRFENFQTKNRKRKIGILFRPNQKDPEILEVDLSPGRPLRESYSGKRVLVFHPNGTFLDRGALRHLNSNDKLLGKTIRDVSIAALHAESKGLWGKLKLLDDSLDLLKYTVLTKKKRR